MPIELREIKVTQELELAAGSSRKVKVPGDVDAGLTRPHPAVVDGDLIALDHHVERCLHHQGRGGPESRDARSQRDLTTQGPRPSNPQVARHLRQVELQRNAALLDYERSALNRE